MLKGDRTMEFRDKPMQNLVRIKEKEICRNVQALLLFLQNIFSGPDSGHIAHFWADIRDFTVFP